ncbi:MAG: VOC family protein [Bryobacteraceae bacterium]|jgi:glyoxylase I family protein
MERVTGIGGLFFRARDPAALAQWYRDHLGVTMVPSNYEEPPWQQQAGPTAFAPFPETTDYFGDSGKAWMVNFRVASLDAMMAQLRAAGIAVELDAQIYPNGRFARLYDPEGNPIELWEPAGRNAP